MNICIPITRDNGLQSPVSPHFGSAPIFLIVDTENGRCQAIPNSNLHRAHGMCQPLPQLAGQSVDAMVVGGIGMGALSRLKAASIRVFHSEHPTVEKTVAAFQTGRLREVTPATACAHHGNGPHEGAWEGGRKGGPRGPCAGSGEMGS
ncbi:MAG: NifB/NifX family molybdenum-iron cluster-binding protein [Thermodesulfobacteriota bacterium]|nr:NifB/NifX family molybdenum-iron cluster-binding protein [Thermodesulfobacteriota bacterium]